MDFVKLAREAFNTPLANRTREATVYNSFNQYLISWGNEDFSNDLNDCGYDELFNEFSRIGWDQNYDIYKMIDEVSHVFGKDAGVDMDNYIDGRLENLFKIWLRVNSLDVVEGKLKRVENG